MHYNRVIILLFGLRTQLSCNKLELRFDSILTRVSGEQQSALIIK